MATQFLKTIEILTSVAGGASGIVLGADGIIQVDTTQFHGTVTYYFEALVTTASAASTLTLRRIGTTTDDASISTASTGLIRSTSFTPPAGAATEYGIFSANTTIRIKSARVVITQSANPILYTETQIELGTLTSSVSTTAAALTNPKYWKYTAANWSGNITVFFEATIKAVSTKETVTASLQVADGTGDGFQNFTTVLTGGITTIVTTTSTTATRVRYNFPTTSGVLISLVDGRNYRIALHTQSSKCAATLYNAKIIIQQDGGVSQSTYYFDGHTSITDPGAVWTNDANAFDGNTGTSASTSTAGSPTSNYLSGVGTTAPGSGNIIRYVTFTVQTVTGNVALAVYDGATQLTNQAVDGYVCPYPSGGWTWTNVNGLEGRFWNISGTAVTASKATFTPTFNDGVTAITATESDYLLCNAALAAGTGLQNALVKWDSTEWVNVTNTYTFAVSATDGNTSTIEADTAGGTQITGSVVTSPDNQGVSSAMTMPADGNLDCKATTNNATLHSARILVATSVNAAADTQEWLMRMAPERGRVIQNIGYGY